MRKRQAEAAAAQDATPSSSPAASPAATTAAGPKSKRTSKSQPKSKAKPGPTPEDGESGVESLIHSRSIRKRRHDDERKSPTKKVKREAQEGPALSTTSGAKKGTIEEAGDDSPMMPEGSRLHDESTGHKTDSDDEEYERWLAAQGDDSDVEEFWPTEDEEDWEGPKDEGHEDDDLLF